MRLYPSCNPDNGNVKATVIVIATIFGLIIAFAIAAAIFSGCKTNAQAEVDAKAGLINDFREMLKEVTVRGDTAGGDVNKPTTDTSNKQVQGITELQLYVIIAAILFGVPLSMYLMNRLQTRQFAKNGILERRKRAYTNLDRNGRA